MEAVSRVKQNIEAVVDAARKAGDEQLASVQRELARERKAREEAEAVLADTTRAYSALREHQALVLSEQGELQATVSQMRDEIRAKDAELSKLKPDHRPSFWSEPKQVGPADRPTYDGLKQKVAEKDAQLDEALAIIKELTEALQGKAAAAAAAQPDGTAGMVCPSCGFGAPAEAEPAAEEAAAGAESDGAASEEEEPAATLTPGLTPSAPMFWVTQSGPAAGGGLLGKLLGGASAK